jgi:hypothetical protein
MADVVFHIHYPDGDFEIVASSEHRPPAVGDTLHRQGKLWRVVATSGSETLIVRVEPVAEPPRDA